MRVVRRAFVLLKSDEGFTDEEIVEHIGCSERTVRGVRKRFATRGSNAALFDAPRSGAPATFTPRQRQQVIALACSEPPEGRVRWTLELLCQHAAEQGIVESVSKSEVALWLAEHDLKPWRKKHGAFPELTEEFRERMEDVLDQYEKPLDPAEPVICLDEQPYQLLDDVRPGDRRRPERMAKQDDEYRRCGTCSVFVAVEPKAGKRFVKPVANGRGSTSPGSSATWSGVIRTPEGFILSSTISTRITRRA